MSRHATCLFTALALALIARPAAAITVDGVLDPEYPAALVTQSVQTGLNAGQIIGDNNQGDLDFANGSELDQGHAFVSNGVLHLFLAGNLAKMLNANQNGTVRHVLDFFVDAVPGGQGTLSNLGSGNPFNGMTFDSGFEADYWFELEGDDNGFQGPRNWTARYAALPTNGGGTLALLGVAVAGGTGALQGGTNPHGILASIDNRNVAGVSFGCGAASGAGATRGSEWAIPLAAIGNPGGCFRITALVRNTGGSVSNQVLGTVPVGTCPLGPAGSVNFAGIAGDQFFTVCQTATDVPDGGNADFALVVLGPNPSRGDRLSVAFALPDARPARLQLFDGAGRVVRRQAVGGTSGRFVAELSAGRRLAPGVYWIRLSQERTAVTRKLSIVR